MNYFVLCLKGENPKQLSGTKNHTLCLSNMMPMVRTLLHPFAILSVNSLRGMIPFIQNQKQKLHARS